MAGTARIAPRRLLAGLAVAALLAGCGASGGSSGSGTGAGSTAPPLPNSASVARSRASHVVTIVMENEESTGVLGGSQAPYIQGLARRYGLATQSYAIRHPSLPNYLALTSGSTHGISSDCTSCSVAAPNLVDQLTAHGIPWAAYLEDLPRPCFAGAGAGEYAKRHNPFAYYADVAGNPSRCRHEQGFSALTRALDRGRLPTYAWISPNLCDDMHDCSVAHGDAFLAKLVPPLLRALGPHGFLVLTWDEGSSNAGCCGTAGGGRIATIVAGPDVRRGARMSQPLDHYGVLRSVEAALGLPYLAGAANSRSGSLASLFSVPLSRLVVSR